MAGYSDSDDLDRVLTALSHPLRRRLMFRLFEATAPAVVDLGDEFGEAELQDARVKLYHVHLPKLADLGYVQWNRDDGTVTPGDDWGGRRTAPGSYLPTRERTPAVPVQRETVDVTSGRFPSGRGTDLVGCARPWWSERRHSSPKPAISSPWTPSSPSSVRVG